MTDRELKEFRKELLDAMKDNREEIKDTVKSTFGLYLKILIAFIIVYGSVLGFNFIERGKNTVQIHELGEDFGTFLFTSPPDHKETQILWDKWISKYYNANKRGAEPIKQ